MRTYKASYDRLGIVASTLCMMHCILLPLLLSTLSVWNIEILENAWIEWIIISITLFAGGWAVWRGYAQWHRKKRVPLIFLLGLTLVIMAGFEVAEEAEMWLKGGGALLMIYAHVINWRLSRTCTVCNEDCLLS